MHIGMIILLTVIYMYSKIFSLIYGENLGGRYNKRYNDQK